MELLIISTLICILDFIAPIIINYVTARFYTRDKVETVLRDDLMNLKQEMASVSMVDEFSRYAKLQRKCTKLESTLTEKLNERLASRLKTRLYITYSFRIVNGIVTTVLLYLYNKEPVIILPKDVLWPVQNLLNWPGSPENSISLLMWIAISKLVLSTCKTADVS